MSGEIGDEMTFFDCVVVYGIEYQCAHKRRKKLGISPWPQQPFVGPHNKEHGNGSKKQYQIKIFQN